jgi:m7GpppX diphosphatase
MTEDTDPDVGFMLLPDTKWDQTTITSLYCLALPLRRDLKSMRDLNYTHLPLLLNMRTKVCC